MKRLQGIEPEVMTTRAIDGKDELNLAEFPLCAVAHRLRPDQKTLHFEDQIWDEGRGDFIDRKLTITGSDAYGLPTALDDEVLLGLIQLSKANSFADRKVAFTRYRLIRLLGWRNESKSYERLEASLNRWMGVTLYYQNAWWNRTSHRWMSEKFHVLDNVRLCHRTDRFPESNECRTVGPGSFFAWNEIIFRSFQCGNLKGIDFQFFKELRSTIARRLYRFLDKRFFHRHRWEFDITNLAWEHIGLARTYDPASLKRKLRPAIMELERKGYLRPMPDHQRFQKVHAGAWRVIFEICKGKAETIDAAKDQPKTDSMVVALIERGVAATRARAMAAQYPPERIQAQLDVFDWLQARTDSRISRNAPGFLLASIKDNFVPPNEFIAAREQTVHRKKTFQRQSKDQEHRRQRAAQKLAMEAAHGNAIGRYWESFLPEERLRLETEAVRQATRFQRDLIEHGGSSGAAALKTVLDAFASRHLPNTLPSNTSGL